MSILSIQSHVTYGYVGNKAATFPLQSMGYDVWPVNTVQFSNHTGYGKWQGEIFSKEHIRNIVKGLEDIGVIDQCEAVLSGYMGSDEICFEVMDIVKYLKSKNEKLIYLCDPVIGNTHCFVKPEVLEFFKNNLRADIITPNQFEAETLSGIKIVDNTTLKQTADYFHSSGTKIVVITGLNFQNQFSIFASDGKNQILIPIKEYAFSIPVNGTGDLFSALFLGNYLKTKSIEVALQRSVYFMDKVLQNTLRSGGRELQVTSTHYDTEPDFAFKQIEI
jgi:pyridoxine kinase